MSEPGTLAPLVDAIELLAGRVVALELGLFITFAVAMLALLLAVRRR